MLKLLKEKEIKNKTLKVKVNATCAIQLQCFKKLPRLLFVDF